VIRDPSDKCSLGVFMGSGQSHLVAVMRKADEIGGHTAEMKALVSSLDFQRYTPRTYVHCHGDEMSLRIITELESSSSPSVRRFDGPRIYLSDIRTISY
jgi:beta-1,4-N-acetylglucosaminyltransferase